MLNSLCYFVTTPEKRERGAWGEEVYKKSREVVSGRYIEEKVFRLSRQIFFRTFAYCFPLFSLNCGWCRVWSTQCTVLAGSCFQALAFEQNRWRWQTVSNTCCSLLIILSYPLFLKLITFIHMQGIDCMFFVYFCFSIFFWDSELGCHK